MSHPTPIRAFYEADGLSTDVYDARTATIIPGSSADGDVDFYRRLAHVTGGPILEVGCGTGRVSVPLAADGHEVVGIDLRRVRTGAPGSLRTSRAPQRARPLRWRATRSRASGQS